MWECSRSKPVATSSSAMCSHTWPAFLSNKVFFCKHTCPVLAGLPATLTTCPVSMYHTCVVSSHIFPLVR